MGMVRSSGPRRRKEEDNIQVVALAHVTGSFFLFTVMSESSFFSNILQPGSSLNPSFLFIVDCILGSLLIVLLSLACLTSGNLHIFALIAIELALWASIKW
jgi:hypothetical protein